MWLWKYKVAVYDEQVGEYKEKGVVCGEALNDAVEQLSTYYGDDLLNLYIEPAGDCEDIYVLESTYKDMYDKMMASSH